MAVRRPRVKPTANLSIKRPCPNNRPSILRTPVAVKEEREEKPAPPDEVKPIKQETVVVPKQETSKPAVPANPFIPPRPSPSPSPVLSPAPMPPRSPGPLLHARSPAHMPSRSPAHTPMSTNSDRMLHLDDLLFKSPIMSPSYPPLSRTPNIPMKVMSPDTRLDDSMKNPNSPSKARHRIRPTPVFAQRRNSSQISEEEEIRIPQRVRHISTSSTASIPKFVPQQVGRIRTESSCSAYSDVSVFKPRRTGRSDEYMKLCEARRDMEKKWNGETPDKSQLRMYDMIYYNPKTNPMKKKTEEGSVDGDNKERRSSVSVIEDVKPEPKKIEPEEEKEEETAMPVPQLKLGPNGEMILDEKSLTIETTGEKEARVTLANADIVYDDSSKCSGFYKRHKRTKEWPAEETIRFYRCLQVIGTDFSLMLDLFPNRTRRDLKLKFKKEEKTNSYLINKALIDHTSFDVEQLREAFKEEDQKKEESREKEAEERAELAKTAKKTGGKRMSLSEKAMDDMNVDLETTSIRFRKNKPQKMKKVSCRPAVPEIPYPSVSPTRELDPAVSPTKGAPPPVENPMASPPAVRNVTFIYYDLDSNCPTRGERRGSESQVDTVQVINPMSVEMIEEQEDPLSATTIPQPMMVKAEKQETSKTVLEIVEVPKEPELTQETSVNDDDDEEDAAEEEMDDGDEEDGLDLSNLVVLEVPNPLTGIITFKVHLMDRETEEMSEEPLDLPQDVIDYIVETHQQKNKADQQ